MIATRAPLLGVTIAALLLLAESVGLRAYKQHQQALESEAKVLKANELAIQQALEAKATLSALIAELERLDEEIRKLSLPSGHPLRKERAKALRELRRVRMEQHELYDSLRPVDPSRVGG